MDLLMLVGAIVMGFLFLFILFMLVVFLLSLFKKESYKDYKGSVTAVIPAYNEEKNITACIKSLKGCTIIVADDGSTDQTAAIAKKLGAKVISTQHQGKVGALNNALKEISTDIFFSVDADVILGKKALMRLLAPFSENDVAATNASVFVHHKGLMSWFQRVEYIYNNLIRTGFSRLFGNSVWFFGAVACYKTKVLKSIGGFSKDTLTEDMDVCLTLYRKGYRIITVKDAHIYTVACSFVGLIKQRMRWYFGALQGLYKNRELRKEKKTVPVAFLFVNQIWWTFFSFIAFPLFYYQVMYWFPKEEVFSYLFRWFSLAGPFYVLYKIPEGWLTIYNFFGIATGILTFIISLCALWYYKKFKVTDLIAMFFYFPYTMILNLSIILGILYYPFRKKKYFIE